MKAWELLGQTRTPDGAEMALTRRDREYVILANGLSLMSSRMHGSEEALATFTCRRMRTLERPCVLVGGLGMGFTLRATLDLLPPDAIVVVAELVPAIVAWNRGPLGPLAGHPLKDRRVVVEVGDVAVTLRASTGRFDAVLLDVDNGPAAFTASHNAGLYDDRGLASARTALKAGGVLAVWSAREDRRFEQRLRHGGFTVEVERVRGRLKKGGPRHTIFLGHNHAAGAGPRR
jgi:spermidine synthase